MSYSKKLPVAVPVGVCILAIGILAIADASRGLSVEAGQNPSSQSSSQAASDPQEDEFDQSFLKARDLAAHQNFKEAIAEFQHAASLKKGNCVDCYRAIGESYIHLKSYKDAAGAYRQALTMNPGNPAELYNSLGVALYFAGEKDKATLNDAVDAFKRAIKLSNNTLVQAYFNLGSALLRLGKHDEGVEAMKTYLKLAPRGPDARQAQMAIDNAESKSKH
jgi:tetratricopeptide (TPR) repeat protein